MNRISILTVLALASSVCFAQLTPNLKPIAKVSDPRMVLDDRGSKLEIFPTKRASEHRSASGDKTERRVIKAKRSAPIGPQQLGVVFNHAMQARGYINGEISFKLKDDQQPGSDFDAKSYPGLAKVTDPNVYVVVAHTIAEYIAVFKRLKARTDLEWVEPTVTYGSLSPSLKKP
jgi:hypothetical protein